MSACKTTADSFGLVGSTVSEKEILFQTILNIWMLQFNCLNARTLNEFQLPVQYALNLVMSTHHQIKPSKRLRAPDCFSLSLFSSRGLKQSIRKPSSRIAGKTKLAIICFQNKNFRKKAWVDDRILTATHAYRVDTSTLISHVPSVRNYLMAIMFSYNDPVDMVWSLRRKKAKRHRQRSYGNTNLSHRINQSTKFCTLFCFIESFSQHVKRIP